MAGTYRRLLPAVFNPRAQDYLANLRKPKADFLVLNNLTGAISVFTAGKHWYVACVLPRIKPFQGKLLSSVQHAAGPRHDLAHDRGKLESTVADRADICAPFCLLPAARCGLHYLFIFPKVASWRCGRLRPWPRTWPMRFENRRRAVRDRSQYRPSRFPGR